MNFEPCFLALTGVLQEPLHLKRLVAGALPIDTEEPEHKADTDDHHDDFDHYIEAIFLHWIPLR